MIYNLIKILIEIGYTKKGAKGIISRRKRELGLSISNYEQVSKDDVVKILDTLSKKGMVSIIMRLDDFEYTEELKEETPNLDSEVKEVPNTEIFESLDYLKMKNESLLSKTKGIPNFSQRSKRGRGSKCFNRHHRR